MNDPRLSQEIREKFATVEFGLDCQQFLDSKIGKYLLHRAEQDVEAGIEALKNVDASQIERVRQIQSDVKRAESFMYWMAEAITAGAEAANELIDAEQSATGDEAATG